MQQLNHESSVAQPITKPQYWLHFLAPLKKCTKKIYYYYHCLLLLCH